MQRIIGRNNAGFVILEAVKTSENEGYALGRSKSQFATWWFVKRGNDIDFAYGHYFPIDKTKVYKSRNAAYTDLYARAAEELRYQVEEEEQ